MTLEENKRAELLVFSHAQSCPDSLMEGMEVCTNSAISAAKVGLQIKEGAWGLTVASEQKETV